MLAGGVEELRDLDIRSRFGQGEVAGPRFRFGDRFSDAGMPRSPLRGGLQRIGGRGQQGVDELDPPVLLSDDARPRSAGRRATLAGDARSPARRVRASTVTPRPRRTGRCASRWPEARKARGEQIVQASAERQRLSAVPLAVTDVHGAGDLECVERVAAGRLVDPAQEGPRDAGPICVRRIRWIAPMLRGPSAR